MIIRRTPKPTEAEFAILNVLWDRGHATAREVYETLYRDEGAGYTTALKMLQVMHGKGLVERDERQRAHVYRPTQPREQVQRQVLADMVQRVFDGRASNLVLSALGNGKATADEIQAIRTLLDRLEKGER